MFKFFCILIALSAVHAQQLPFRLSLDRNYVLSWGFDNQTMTFQLEVENKGWVALALVSDDGALLDVWLGGYDEEYNVPYMQVSLLRIYKIFQI